MAGRKPGFRHSEETRQKIQGALIVKRLQDHVMAKEDLMSTSQVNAAKVLLNKIIPDLAAVQLSGDPDAPLQMKVTLGGDA